MRKIRLRWFRHVKRRCTDTLERVGEMSVMNGFRRRKGLQRDLLAGFRSSREEEERDEEGWGRLVWASADGIFVSGFVLELLCDEEGWGRLVWASADGIFVSGFLGLYAAKVMYRSNAILNFTNCCDSSSNGNITRTSSGQSSVDHEDLVLDGSKNVEIELNLKTSDTPNDSGVVSTDLSYDYANHGSPACSWTEVDLEVIMEENSKIELTDTDVKPTFMFSEDILRPDEICNSKNLIEDVGTRLEYMEHCLMDDNCSMEATKILDTFCLTENNDEAFNFQRFLEESFDFKYLKSLLR
ncbi:hypothetical protein MTR67_045204 [Solanum verrucosum]|uniref:Uncharacterized protein n=1 Tax=Solanum verrucosum TaxID=315347 RepID=A0AAF0UU43_SOLVR|nr:hypothetical protein MTR67_045204 [Solanum verrucosum]